VAVVQPAATLYCAHMVRCTCRSL